MLYYHFRFPVYGMAIHSGVGSVIPEVITITDMLAAEGVSCYVLLCVDEAWQSCMVFYGGNERHVKNIWLPKWCVNDGGRRTCC